MEQTTKQRRSKKMKNTITIGLVIVMLLSGTYTWSAISQKALNETYDLVNPGGRLHDDYDGNNKDVYVENFGEAPIFVRVRLDEYMDVDGVPITTKNSPTSSDGSEPVRDDVSTWTTYNPYVSDKKDNVSNTYFDLIFGDRTATNKGQKWYMPTFNMSHGNLRADQPNPKHDFDSSAGNLDTLDDNEPWDGTNADIDNMPANSDVQSGQYQSNLSGTKEEAKADYWAPDNAGDPAKEKAAPEWFWDPDAGTSGETVADTANSTHTAALTRTSNVISMAAWKASNMKLGDFWVYDTDGWAYWAGRVWPSEATGLLLDEIKQSIYFDPQGDWYYAVNVVGQFATADDWESKFDNTHASKTAGAATSDAKDLLKLVASGYAPGSTFEIPISPTSTTLVKWRVLAKDAAGNMLVITDQTITSSPAAIAYNNAANTFVDYATTAEASLNIKKQMNDWYTANAGYLADRDLKWEAVNLPIERPTSTIAWPTQLNAWSGAWKKSLSTPGTQEASDFKDVVFPLSISDFYEYGSRDNGGTGNNPNGKATLGSAGNIYWLRSPGNNNTGSAGAAANVTGNNAVTSLATNSASYYIRPALWIKPY